MLLILLFSVQFSKWGLPSLPVGGVRDLRGDGGIRDRIEHLILPITALVMPQIAVWLFYVRSNMIEVIQQDYMRAAAAKGLKQKSVLYGHGFRNVLIPLVTLLGLSIPDVFAGSLIVENVFAYPGMGRLAITAINDKDHTTGYGDHLDVCDPGDCRNLIADILYAVVDPRIRLD